MNLPPKQKAEKLISEYINIQNSWYLENLVDGLRIAQAKKCALIAIKFAKENPLNTNGYNKYLQQVETEIEKL
jgi:hypothetical protein